MLFLAFLVMLNFLWQDIRFYWGMVEVYIINEHIKEFILVEIAQAQGGGEISGGF